MSMLDLRALLRVYTPGRRVRFKPDAEAVRDKVPSGIESGVIVQIVPLPLPETQALSAADLRDHLPTAAFGLEIEFDRPDRIDTVMLGKDDIVLDALDLDQIRTELWHRTVHFPRSSGIGISFPPGAADDGLIEDVRLRQEDDGRMSDLAIGLRIAVDPAVHPRGIDTFYAEADFTQCRLRRRTLPAKK